MRCMDSTLAWNMWDVGCTEFPEILYWCLGAQECIRILFQGSLRSDYGKDWLVLLILVENLIAG